MDPAAPWSAYASYNRLAGVQAGAAGGDFHHHLAGGGTGLAGHNPAGSVPTTAGQLLLQAAHTSASLSGQLGSSAASPFNPGPFLSPPPVGYDAVFSPLFHHANPKPAHYSSAINAQHRQAIAQVQAAASKQAAESELSSLRESYHSHQQTLQAAAQNSAFFDQAPAPAGGASGLAWQGNSQLPSPFGILPHESVVPSSPGPAAAKSSSTAVYDNFNAHFAAAQTLNNHLSSQLVANAGKAARSASPQVAPPVKPVASQASAPAPAFFQTPATFGGPSENVSSYSNAKSGQISTQQDYAGGKQRANSAAQPPPAAPPQQSPAARDVSKMPDKKTAAAPGAGSGFMASYLKFLQGERDTSPPPATRGGRKATWSRSGAAGAKPFNAPNDHGKGDRNSPAHNSNGATGLPPGAPGVPSPAGVVDSPGAAGAMISPAAPKPVDPHDDPRFFPGAKDRKRKSDGSEEGYDGADDEARRLGKPVLNVPSAPLNEKGKKGRGGAKPQGGAGPPTAAPPKKARGGAQLPPPPAQAQPQQQYYYQQPDEAAAHGAGIDYADYSSEEETNAAKKMGLQRTLQHSLPLSQQTLPARPAEEMPYQSGEFVAIKSELTEAWPAIWRVDGKALLQKYEPFDQNGKVLYRNISTYAAWNPENKKLYSQVTVRVRAQTHLETIVELMRNEVLMDDNEFMEKRMQDTILYQDNFEVYIQTLISHALDPNFLTEIFQEQDEYFLSNVKTVDDITEERRRRVASGAGWSRGLEAALAAWPCLGVAELASGVPCSACRVQRASHRIQAYGQPYNAATLEPCQPDPRVAYDKEVAACRSCAHRVELFNRISHQKYLMFLECNKRVADKRVQDPLKDTTLILNELLADEPWLSQLFRDIRQSWAEAESMERKSRQALSMPRQHM